MIGLSVQYFITINFGTTSSMESTLRKLEMYQVVNINIDNYCTVWKNLTVAYNHITGTQSYQSLMLGTEVVTETSVSYSNQLSLLVGREDFIEFGFRAGLRLQIIWPIKMFLLKEYLNQI